MSLELTDVKKYLRIDFDNDNEYISDLIEMSKAYIKEQTGKVYTAGNKVYEQAVLLMVAGFYDNRTPFSEKAVNEQNCMSLKSMLNHIAMVNYTADDDSDANKDYIEVWQLNGDNNGAAANEGNDE